MKQATLKFNSEKKHSIRYDAVDKDAVLSSAYIRKADLPRPLPLEIKITVEWK